MSNRDTQFQGFAKALMSELDTVSTTTYASLDKAREAYELAIARRAYDLACHAIDNSRSNDMEDWETERIMPYVPDLTELPKEIDEKEVAKQKEIDEILSHASELDAMELYEKLCNVGLPKEQE